MKSFVFFFVTLVLRAKILPLQLWSPYKNGIYRLEVSQIFSAPNQGVCSIPWPYVFLQTPSPAIATRLNKTLELGVEYVLTGVINQTGKVMRMNMCYWYKTSCNKDSDNENLP